MWNTPHRVEIAEYTALACTIIGLIAAAISGQAKWALFPLTISVALNLITRYRVNQANWRRTSAAIARIQQQLSEELVTKQTPTEVKPSETETPADNTLIYQNLKSLQEQCTTLQESVSSVIHYLNTSAVIERVDRLERNLNQFSERLAGLANSLETLQQRRREETKNSPQLPSPQVSVQPHSTTPATTAKPVLLPRIATSTLTPQKWQCKTTHNAHTDWISALAISPDGQHLVSGSFDKTLKIWDLHTGLLLHTLTAHLRGIFSVAITPDSQMFASASWDQTIKFWNITSGEMLDSIVAHSGSVRAIAISPDGKMLASGSFDETIKIWQTGTGILQHRLTDYSGPVYALKFSPDGQILASGGGDGLIHLWSLPEASQIASLSGNLDFVWSLTISPDGELLASGNGDGTVKIWQLPNRELLGTIAEHTGPVYCITFTPDGNTLITGSADGTVKMWDMITGECVCTLSEDNQPVISLAISPSGQLLSTGSANGTLKIWQRE
ncbi:WD40 repeat domain-containing protein [Ancylothrix sp. C2]|uniref:WD40 repeat domain-containing protein n=1 Tax=Ancylothrix sp. D3o TaxID=2953691 RepID=UPI0021BAC636|nr:WD40 repeat domain-containing protein [Ancylothrix sp. D3o]MCT7951590.1 WD40 repeat domain-containing protein [Ancylothrix sp. D3o]